MAAAELKLIPVELLDDHPDNPRIVYRDDVIDAIAANLNGSWPQQHALHVRPVGDRFQIVAGHTRRRAADKKGMREVWAWVEDLDDEAAYMLLATSNNQGELSPLEIGLHALKAVPTGKGGRGKKGGLSEYAEKIGKNFRTISEYKQAAEVIQNVPVDRRVFLDKAQHLSAIHKLPKACWQTCCTWLAENDLAAKDVQKRVDESRKFLDECEKGDVIDSRWRHAYLKPENCAAAIFAGEKPKTFFMLSQLALKVAEDLPEDLAEQWIEWLNDRACADSWDVKKVQAKRIELDTVRMEREAQVQTNLVSVLLADPPWKYDFAETENRQIENQYPTATVDEICSHIHAPWAPELAEDCVLFLWATAPKLQEAMKVMESWGFAYKTHAVWDKKKIGMGYWFRGRHELLLVGTRGVFSPPEAANRFSSVFEEERAAKHSKKPECVYTAIEAMFPGVLKFEMYQRKSREGWLAGGNEA